MARNPTPDGSCLLGHTLRDGQSRFTALRRGPSPQRATSHGGPSCGPSGARSLRSPDRPSNTESPPTRTWSFLPKNGGPGRRIRTPYSSSFTARCSPVSDARPRVTTSGRRKARTVAPAANSRMSSEVVRPSCSAGHEEPCSVQDRDAPTPLTLPTNPSPGGQPASKHGVDVKTLFGPFDQLFQEFLCGRRTAPIPPIALVGHRHSPGGARNVDWGCSITAVLAAEPSSPGGS